MATIGNDSNSFLHALSDFWIRFFADIGDLKATYEGSTILFGQAYLDLLTTVLNTSVTEAPLFRKEYYRLVTLREDEMWWEQDFVDSTKSRWADQSGNLFKEVGALQNKVYSPDAAFALGTDVEIGADGGLKFITTDPTEEPTPALFGSRKVTVGVGGVFSSGSWDGTTLIPTADWLALGVKKGDVLWTHPYATLVQGDRTLENAQRFRIVHVTATELRLSTTTPGPQFPAEYSQRSVSWWIDRESPAGGYDASLPWTDRPGNITSQDRGVFFPSTNIDVTEVAVWAVDAKVDDYALYENFGHLVTGKGASTEPYRALVRGLMQLYLFGPAVDRIESALNVVANLSVARNDGETLTGYSSGLGVTWNGSSGSFGSGLFNSGAAIWSSTDVGGYVEITLADAPANVGVFRIAQVISPTVVQLEVPGGLVAQASGVRWEYSKTDLQTVTTSAGSYYFDRRIPMRSDIVNWNGVDVITFKAFEPLTAGVRVVDYVKDPTWWHNLPVPEQLLPDATPEERLASTQLLKGMVGPEYLGHVGDPGYYVGADENGTLGGTYRHRPAFILMDRFLQAHIFQVKIDKEVKLSPELVGSLTSVMLEAKPAFTYAYLQPGTAFNELVSITDLLSAAATREQYELMGQQAHPLTVGSTPSWTVGQQWRFTASTGYAVTMSAAGGAFKTLDVGGLDPQSTPVAQGATTGAFESALYVVSV